MGKKLLGTLLLFGMLKCSAQVSITLQVPPGGVLLKSQLWNMGLVYTGNTPLQVWISLTVTDEVTNQPVLIGSSAAITLTNGARQLLVSDAGPIQYRYPSAAVTDRNPDGFLPAGSYQACYAVMTPDKTNPAPLAEDCTTFEVAPMSPPMLNTPFNEDTILVKFPQFTWMSPTPLNIFSNLSYKFNLVEVAPGQNPMDAVTQNMPVYTDNNCADVYVNYPSSAMALDTGKTYAWQIIAQSNRQPVAQSEVWTFHLGQSKLTAKPNISRYIVLKNSDKASGTYVADAGFMGLKFYSFDKTHNTVIIFRKPGGAVVKSTQEKIEYGDNFLVYPTGSTFKKGEVYTIEITDLQHKKYTASFIIQ